MPFRFVFEVKVRPSEDEAFIINWRELSIVIQEYPGARGTRLHKKHGEESTYIAIAEWESAEARQAAMSDIEQGQSDQAKRIARLRKNEDFGKMIHIADLDEIEEVLPDQRAKP